MNGYKNVPLDEAIPYIEDEHERWEAVRDPLTSARDRHTTMMGRISSDAIGVILHSEVELGDGVTMRPGLYAVAATHGRADEMYTIHPTAEARATIVASLRAIMEAEDPETKPIDFGEAGKLDVVDGGTVEMTASPVTRPRGGVVRFIEVMMAYALQDAEGDPDLQKFILRQLVPQVRHESEGQGQECDALTIRGGSVFSQLTRAATRRSKPNKVTLKNRKSETVVVVKSLKDALALKPSGRKTLTLLDREATRMSRAGEYRHDGETVCRVVLSVKDTAKLYGITEGSARNRLRRDFRAIANETLTIEKRGKGGGWVTIPVAGGSYGIRGDRAAFTFSPDVMTFLFNPTASQIDLPPELFATDDTNHPAAFQIGVKLYTHDNQNHGEAAPDRLKLTTLLNAARELPTPEELEKARRSKTERIMGPFEAAMEHLVDVGALKAWDYCHENGEPLTDEEYQRIETEHDLGKPTPWDLAEGLLVTWELGRRYPKREAARMASREKRLEEKVAAKAKREKEAKAKERRIRSKTEKAVAEKLAAEELAARGSEAGAGDTCR